MKNPLEIIPNDKDTLLVTNFLGWRRGKGTNSNPITFIIPNKGGVTPINKLLFHKDWNWLMMLVDAIEELTYRVRFEMETCFILNSDFETIIDTTGNERTKIEAVYTACINFIKWYEEENNVK